MEKLDKKFYGEIRRVKDDVVVPDDQYVVFLAKDNAFAEILPLYLAKCVELKCDKEQIVAVSKLLITVQTWRTNNQDKCKKPDAAGEKLLP